jgi:hypothetical protein
MGCLTNKSLGVSFGKRFPHSRLVGDRQVRVVPVWAVAESFSSELRKDRPQEEGINDNASLVIKRQGYRDVLI